MHTDRLVRVTILGVALMAAHMAAAPGNNANDANTANSAEHAQNEQKFSIHGMVMKVAPSRKSFVVSHDSIPGVMEAMTMSFEVREPGELDGVVPGMTVEFTLVVGPESGHAEHVQIRRYETAEQDPLTAKRLKLLKEMTTAPDAAVKPLAIGQAVPDFTLTDQARHPVTLSEFRGKVVAITFIYTSCTLPQFCFRLANQFGAIHKRFTDRMGRDLILITVTFDPVRDQPERLAEYASQWKANPATWHFLTGAVPDVARVCGLFGVDFFPDEGLMDHSSHTAVIDRQGRLVANIEGNQFTAAQLGDLVDVTLSSRD
jgi:protein SCO1/2